MKKLTLKWTIVILVVGTSLLSLNSCKSSKCDCPKFSKRSPTTLPSDLMPQSDEVAADKIEWTKASSLEKGKAPRLQN